MKRRGIDRLKKDIESRPEESSIDDYERVPVSAFGSAMLQSLGWSEGAPIGLTNAIVFEPVLTKKRGRGHLGLGATPKDTDNELPHKKKREADDDEKKKKKKEMGEGSFVIITGGRNEGLKGRIKSMETTHVNIVLETSSETVRVRRDDVVEDTPEAREKLAKEKKERKEKNKSSSSSSDKKKVTEKEPWLLPGLVVRVIDKNLKKGTFYLKKAIIEDVHSPHDCSIKLMEGSSLVDARDKMLETVIPRKEGEPLMVVGGSRRGMKGKFMEKVKGEKGDSFVVVQLQETLEVLQYPLERVCMLAGGY
ncbi:G patch domain and KOW motifs-containing protein-like [Planoprotostelium fungivorum]|uniref:G patch domain and KOW motifs-containing protein-like n=1 Tax=Planoprotostelium fungivorum TaxID=1890364 RepID=A0A2P6N2W4_9EUKA|nr:G patch domain and KOW motifs-containing protein-like [Planoprotostelium fungivorum]PRP83420.1 G patch domain and KOW motifs-containing protein-like [Planoprotostelium fungivorum]